MLNGLRLDLDDLPAVNESLSVAFQLDLVAYQASLVESQVHSRRNFD